MGRNKSDSLSSRSEDPPRQLGEACGHPQWHLCPGSSLLQGLEWSQQGLEVHPQRQLGWLLAVVLAQQGWGYLEWRPHLPQGCLPHQPWRCQPWHQASAGSAALC